MSPPSASTTHAPRCPACGGSRIARDPGLATRIRLAPPEALLLCRTCGMGWVDPQLRSEHPYDDEYFEQDFAGGVDSLPEHLAQRLDSMERDRRTGRLLEIGCGHGTFLAAAIARGWQAEGADVSAACAELVYRTAGVRLHVGELESLPLDAGAYDAIHMNHVLEHLPDPLATLQQVRTLLRPGGRVDIEVPNELAALYDDLRWKLLRRWDARPTPSSHLSFFTPRALRLIVEQAGLRTDSLTTARRNKQDADSRIWLGRAVKRSLYSIEDRFCRGPNIVLIARRED